ncbi:hypothetical protein [cf. Phormidesmis sp. LEGE 11477]|uniref:hypothetical protein n=1 Tax=cf. Phormidesmis sp. LEGE 11477 TaxID=1828680 RepID=UPI00187EE7CD|nr:hypothetical protein [cf. Phormidesmis sp. LEGE 11477]MBE9059912.1 hypothetical protein [cf. Phormidesmis sp. LEGE 11477]
MEETHSNRFNRTGFFTHAQESVVQLVGTIAATTAAGLTTAFGEAYIAALDMSFVQNNDEPPPSEKVAEGFKTKYLQLADGG